MSAAEYLAEVKARAGARLEASEASLEDYGRAVANGLLDDEDIVKGLAFGYATFTAYEALRTDVPRLVAAVEAVLALHVDKWVVIDTVGGYVCAEDGEPTESEPCTTVRAITAALGATP